MNSGPIKRAGVRAAAAAAAAAALLAGCYTDRNTGNYLDIPFLTDEDAAVLEVSGHDAESAAKRRARLEEIANEPPQPYRMNSGDEIEIRVYGNDDLSEKTRIGPDGTIGFAFAGQIELGGKTIAEGSEAVREAIEPYVKNPVVSISLKTVSSETATIAGACADPGVYPISTDTRLADVYAMAGSSAFRLFNGVNIDAADLEHSIFVRDGEILPVDFLLAINSGDPLHNIRVRKGDYIFIAQRMDASVTICGEVRNPHKRLYEPGMGLLETLASAGWMGDDHWKHVIVIRDGLSDPKMFKVDVDGILAGKCNNVALKANDIVYVPKDNLAEYNVFVNKLLPTAHLVYLAANKITDRTVFDDQ